MRRGARRGDPMKDAQYPTISRYINSLINRLFAAGAKSWSPDARHFEPPPSIPDIAEAWQPGYDNSNSKPEAKQRK